MGDASRIRVSFLYSSGPREVVEIELSLRAGATVLEAVEASGVFVANNPRELRVGVWSRKARLDHMLRDGDRVEVYRDLLVDPKVARRERFRKQGSRAAGLFARRKPGAKAGY